MPYDFSNGKIYKLVCDVSDSFYVGSTTTALSKRRFQHSHHPMPGVKLLFDEIGWKELKIVLVEAWPCNNNEELRQRERYWYDKLKPDLNRKRPHVTTAEKRVYHAAYDLEYRAKPGAAEKAKAYNAEYIADPINKERRKVQQAVYLAKPEVKEMVKVRQAVYLAKPGVVEKIKAQKAVYHAKPGVVEKIKAQKAAYQQLPENKARNKARASKRTLCECGCEVSRGNISAHQRTQKHHQLFSQAVANFIHS